ncbi:MAG: sulfatase family protein [Verrucomicrobiales bacterium]
MKALLAILLATLCALPLSARKEKPNIILIFVDDLGYNDLSCYGSQKIRTPQLDHIARDGRRFTNFHTAANVCTPSRAALLTACYPKRVSLHQHVLFPQSKKGLNPDEYTIAKHFQKNGYATACVGKWHLGHYPETLPRAHGFDSYFGIPYSNDMNHPDNKKNIHAASDEAWREQSATLTKWRTPLVENEDIIELPCDQRTITRRYTDRALAFIKENHERPFFLYLPHSMPHIPLFVPADVQDPDPQNAYTNTIEHIDAEIGRIRQHLADSGLAENTYLIFTSDNGPWIQFKHHGGSALPFRSGKGTNFEGGHRVPFLISGPGIPKNSQSDAFISALDLFPTLAELCGLPLSAPQAIDGHSLSGTLTADTPSPRRELLFYNSRGKLNGLTQDNWKLLINPNSGPKNTTYLFDLAADPHEKNNLAADQPERLAALKKRMNELDAELTQNQRPAWTTEQAHPWPANPLP